MTKPARAKRSVVRSTRKPIVAAVDEVGPAVAPEIDPLLDLAAAIADGSAIDWDHLENRRSGEEQQHVLEQLRLISVIAAVCRNRGDIPDQEPGGDRSRTAAVPGDDGVAVETQPQRWGEFILLEEVGHGSNGTVYRAHDPRLDRLVAVKILRRAFATDEQLAARLLHEGRTLARVRHVNVVAVYGAGEHENRVGLWMEFIRGLTLEQMLRQGPFSAREAALVGFEICGALAAVHHAGLVHRDVKAQNVMREEGGRLVLMDFGAGQRLAEAGPGGRLVGTPSYLAPEVLNGAEATIASDLYGLGVLLYHLVTNSYPVKADTIGGLILAHARGEATALHDARPDLPKPFVHIVERATDPDPARRFASAGRMEAALGGILGSTVNIAAPRLRRSDQKANAAVPVVAVRRPGGQDVPSVAVLPFTDMSPAKDQEWFCDGITEELINALTQISGLRVVARTSAFQFKGQARDVRQIGEALNVATILDGSVRKDGNRLRITVELIGAADGFHLWSQRFDREMVDVFAVQDQIAAAVVETLKGNLAADFSAVTRHRTRDLAAYGSYLEGRYHWNKRTEEELKRSVRCFELAIDRDPEYAQAYAGLADAYVTLATYGAMAPEELMPRARHALERGLEIDAQLAEAYACRGCVRSVYDWAWAQADEDFRRAIALLPAYATAHHWYAINHLVPLGRFDEATEHLRRALDPDPLALAVMTSLGMKCYFAGEYDAAVRELAKTIELDQSFGMAHFFLGQTCVELGRFDQALVEIEVALRLSGRTPEILAALGSLQAVAGDAAAARGVLDELRQLAGERYVSPAKLAQVHVGLGEHAQALDRLEEAHRQRAVDLAWLGVRPVFAGLRAEPRFIALKQQIGLAAPA